LSYTPKQRGYIAGQIHPVTCRFALLQLKEKPDPAIPASYRSAQHPCDSIRTFRPLSAFSAQDIPARRHSMMDDRPDLERRREFEPLGVPPPATNDDASFAVPAIIIAAILIIGGYFVVTYNGDNVRTASNNTPTQSAPAPAPSVAPPLTTPPAAPQTK
jgi:hypothetical protein